MYLDVLALEVRLRWSVEGMKRQTSSGLYILLNLRSGVTHIPLTHGRNPANGPIDRRSTKRICFWWDLLSCVVCAGSRVGRTFEVGGASGSSNYNSVVTQSAKTTHQRAVHCIGTSRISVWSQIQSCQRSERWKVISMHTSVIRRILQAESIWWINISS